ncbi:MAG: type IX secretion system membrane protein PorP/SprF, partial [Flavobacteriaceae bacterium]|nr:type IX secretion system membrane protein PorP/SprF [Flavobacteriaceae bacterium]
LNLNYSYHLKLSENWTFFPGIAFGVGYKDFHFEGLLFEDQIDLVGGSNPITTDPIFNHIAENVFFIDIAAGGVLYAKNAWLGFSFKHLTKPNISFVENENLPLAIHYSIHGGYQLALDTKGRNSFLPKDSNLFFTFNYMKQDIYNRFDFGAEVEIHKFSIGFLSSSVIQKIEPSSDLFLSISPVIGIESQHFKFGFSYDFPISNFSNIGGTSEITLQYFIDNNYTRRSRWQRKH